MKLFLLAMVSTMTLVIAAPEPAAQETLRTASINGDKYSVRVTGYGEVSLVPDMAHIYIGVHTQAQQAEDAIAENNAQTQKVLDTLALYGIAEEDIQTINFSIYPRQEYDQMGQPTVLYYNVQNTVWVTVRNLATIGELLDAVIGAGASTISGLQFDIADRGPARAQALSSAVAAALEKAQILAQAAGVTVGDVMSLDTVYGGSYYFDAGRDEGAGSGNSGVPVSPGELKVTASVTAIYEIY